MTRSAYPCAILVMICFATIKAVLDFKLDDTLGIILNQGEKSMGDQHEYSQGKAAG